MRTLSAFMQVTLDGYFASPDGGVEWGHRGSDDPDFAAFVADNAKSGGVLLFGRRTYEMMASYWPTPLAKQQNPVVAEHMNRMPKLVASRSLERVTWENTEIIEGELVERVKELKREGGDGITILGSASVVTALSDAGLIDEYQFVVSPIALGAGKTQLLGLKKALDLRLTRSRTFENGKVFLSYAPAR